LKNFARSTFCATRRDADLPVLVADALKHRHEGREIFAQRHGQRVLGEDDAVAAVEAVDGLGVRLLERGFAEQV
jgi:hypothetical protein